MEEQLATLVPSRIYLHLFLYLSTNVTVAAVLVDATHADVTPDVPHLVPTYTKETRVDVILVVVIPALATPTTTTLT